jgi:hypothetical protein
MVTEAGRLPAYIQGSDLILLRYSSFRYFCLALAALSQRRIETDGQMLSNGALFAKSAQARQSLKINFG